MGKMPEAQNFLIPPRIFTKVGTNIKTWSVDVHRIIRTITPFKILYGDGEVKVTMREEGGHVFLFQKEKIWLHFIFQTLYF